MWHNITVAWTEVNSFEPFNEHYSVFLLCSLGIAFKMSHSRLSFVLSCRVLMFQAPAVIGKHGNIPSSLVSTFHFADVVMEPLSLLFAVTSQIIQKILKM